MGECIERVESDGHQDHPPSWEEVMQEKNSSFKGKNPINSNINQEVEILTANQRLARTFNNIITILGTTAQWGTVLSDLVLLMCSLATLVLGCLILDRHFEVVRVVFTTQFLTIGHILVVISSLNLALFGPLGITGALKKRRSFLKWHNIWLLLNVLIHLVFFYLCFRYLNKTELKRKKDFKLGIESTYTLCYVKEEGDSCCCEKKNSNETDICWKLDQVATNSLRWNGAHWQDFDIRRHNSVDNYLKKYKIVRRNCESDHTDYYRRTIDIIQKGFLYLGINIIVEGFPLFFGTLTLLVYHFPEEEELDEEPEESPVKAKKESKKMSLFKKVLIFFVVKRLFFICLTGVLVLAYYSIKKVTENINIKVPLDGNIPVTVNLWDLISSIFKS